MVIVASSAFDEIFAFNEMVCRNRISRGTIQDYYSTHDLASGRYVIPLDISGCFRLLRVSSVQGWDRYLNHQETHC